jgi:prepilin-type processing-associated H-X9-DG protein
LGFVAKVPAQGRRRGVGDGAGQPPVANQPALNITRIAQPVETILYADAAQVNTFQAPASPDNPLLEEFYYVNSIEATAHFRHQQFANAVFCDGHVARERPVPGSIDQKLPAALVGRLRPESLQVP